MKKLRFLTYRNLIFFSGFFLTPLGDCFSDALDLLSVTFLLLINSEKDGIAGKIVLGESLCVGDRATEASSLTLSCKSFLVISVALSTKGDGVAKGPVSTNGDCDAEGAVLSGVFSDGELVMGQRRSVKSVEFTVDNHLTVLAT